MINMVRVLKGLTSGCDVKGITQRVGYLVAHSPETVCGDVVFYSLQKEPLSKVSNLLLGQLHLVELLHVLLVVLFLQLPDENELLLGTVRVLLRRILLELHGCLRI